MNGLLLFLFLSTSLAPGTLNPNLTPDLPALQDVWKQGYAYAQHHKDLYRPLGLARHGLGKLEGHWVSWVIFVHPCLVAYQAGFEAGKQHLASSQQSASLSALANIVQEETKQLQFHVNLGVYPHGAFLLGGSYRGSRADPNVLQGAQVQLQIGNRVYDPLYQPQTIVPKPHKAIRVYTQPTSGPELVTNMSESYIWYEGQFDVTFALFNPDGTPRITANDNEITVLVSGGFGQQSAKFNLKEWLNAYEK